MDCSVIHGPVDAMRQTTPDTLSLEVSGWFDEHGTLERFARWRVENRSLRVSRAMCEDFRRAWCRWFVRLQPLGVMRPRWMRGHDEYKRIAFGYNAPNMDIMPLISECAHVNEFTLNVTKEN